MFKLIKNNKYNIIKSVREYISKSHDIYIM